MVVIILAGRQYKNRKEFEWRWEYKNIIRKVLNQDENCKELKELEKEKLWMGREEQFYYTGG